MKFSIFDLFSFGKKGKKDEGSFEEVYKEFESFFKMDNNTKKRGSSSAAGGKIKGKDIQITLELDFLEAINGGARMVQFAKVNSCGTCKGTKMKPGTHKNTCSTCSGAGYVTEKHGHAVV